jgi:flavin-dependent thymidylate synthase
MLIRYLCRHRHTTPSEMCEIKLHFRIPMDDHRQVIRHRTASVNEYSTRYSDVIKKTRRTRPKEWRLQDQQNKQGSQEGDIVWPDGYVVKRAEEGSRHGTLFVHGKPLMIVENVDKFTPAQFLTRKQAVVHMTNGEFYDQLREFGIAREQARQNIVISTYTEYYWCIDAHNLFHFLMLRMDSHAQWEIRQYANAIAKIVEQWLPLSWAAFKDYVLNAVTLTARDLNVLQSCRPCPVAVLRSLASVQAAVVDTLAFPCTTVVDTAASRVKFPLDSPLQMAVSNTQRDANLNLSDHQRQRALARTSLPCCRGVRCNECARKHLRCMLHTLAQGLRFDVPTQLCVD